MTEGESYSRPSVISVTNSENRAFSRAFLRRQSEPRFGPPPIDNPRRDISAQRRPMLEPVTRSPADQPHVGEIGMAVTQEIAVRGVFVLADARFDERRVRQRRESFG